MNLKLLIALLVCGAAVSAQELICNQEQLEEKVVVYWTAFVEGDYMAAYAMYPAYMRSEISFFEWFEIVGFEEYRQEGSGLRLSSVEILSISHANDPNFSHLYEVFLRLRVKSQIGMYQDELVSNVWELDEDGNWAPAMPLVVGQ